MAFEIEITEALPLHHLCLTLYFNKKSYQKPPKAKALPKPSSPLPTELIEEEKKEETKSFSISTKIKKEEKDKDMKTEEKSFELGLLSLKSTGNRIKSSENEHDNHIPLMVYSHTGAQYNSQHQASRIVTDNQVLFASNYPIPQFIFSQLHGKRMLIEKVNLSLCL
jgi:hypothetical protein